MNRLLILIVLHECLFSPSDAQRLIVYECSELAVACASRACIYRSCLRYTKSALNGSPEYGGGRIRIGEVR